jgi:hypothetical protein
VHVDGAERDQLLALQARELAVDEVDEVGQLGHLPLVAHLERLLVALLQLVKRVVDLRGGGGRAVAVRWRRARARASAA